MYRFLILFFTITLSLFAAPKEERLLAVTEGEPSALVAGCVNAITGDLHLAEQDVVVQGYVPLRLPRHYISGAGEGILAGWEFIDHLEAPRTMQAVKTSQMWTSTKKETSVRNAYDHWKRHSSDFPALQNAKQYVETTQNFINNPPPGTLMRIRKDGGIVLYDLSSNTFATTNYQGLPRTMYKPSTGKHPYPTNMDYFNAQ